MKKILGIFLCGMLVLFLAMPAAADMLVEDNVGYVDTSDDYFGSDVDDLWYEGDTNPDMIKPTNPDTELAWLRSLLDLDHTDTSVYFIYKDEDGGNGWQAPGDWTYAVLKYGVGDGADIQYSDPDHWAIMDTGNEVVDFGDIWYLGELYTDLPSLDSLSHISYFGPGDPPPVPEPATMLLLGTGLIGLAGAGRKKLFK